MAQSCNSATGGQELWDCLNRADGRIYVAALRPPCQGKAYIGQGPMMGGTAQLNAATQVRVPGNTARPSSHSCTYYVKNPNTNIFKSLRLLPLVATR